MVTVIRTFYQRQIIRLLVQRKLQKSSLWITMDTKQMEFLFRIMSFTMQWGLTFSLRMANLAGFVN